jgi:hypothetical protein
MREKERYKWTEYQLWMSFDNWQHFSSLSQQFFVWLKKFSRKCGNSTFSWLLFSFSSGRKYQVHTFMSDLSILIHWKRHKVIELWLGVVQWKRVSSSVVVHWRIWMYNRAPNGAAQQFFRRDFMRYFMCFLVETIFSVVDSFFQQLDVFFSKTFVICRLKCAPDFRERALTIEGNYLCQRKQFQPKNTAIISQNLVEKAFKPVLSYSSFRKTFGPWRSIRRSGTEASIC